MVVQEATSVSKRETVYVCLTWIIDWCSRTDADLHTSTHYCGTLGAPPSKPELYHNAKRMWSWCSGHYRVQMAPPSKPELKPRLRPVALWWPFQVRESWTCEPMSEMHILAIAACVMFRCNCSIRDVSRCIQRNISSLTSVLYCGGHAADVAPNGKKWQHH